MWHSNKKDIKKDANHSPFKFLPIKIHHVDQNDAKLVQVSSAICGIFSFSFYDVMLHIFHVIGTIAGGQVDQKLSINNMANNPRGDENRNIARTRKVKQINKLEIGVDIHSRNPKLLYCNREIMLPRNLFSVTKDQRQQTNNSDLRLRFASLYSCGPDFFDDCYNVWFWLGKTCRYI